MKKILKQDSFTEQDVMFVFSELRKYMESSETSYAVIKFYADWLLHSRKDRVNSQMKSTLKEIYEYSVKHMHNSFKYEYANKAKSFIYFETLKEELEKLFSAHNLNKELFQEETWLNFMRSLVKLLEEQPIVNPIPELSEVVFQPTIDGAVGLVLIFSESISVKGENYSYYRILNYY